MPAVAPSRRWPYWIWRSAAPKRLPYDFFGRLLRCEILADNGSYALVAGLTLQMGEQCPRWFAREAGSIPPAKLLLTALRIRCLLQWADSTKTSGPDESTARSETG